MSYTTLANTDFVISADSITAPAWSSNQPTLSQFNTASAVVSTTISAGAFYLNVYQTSSVLAEAAVQFSIAYGNSTGLGAPYYNTLVPGVTPSLTTYKQYRTMVYGPSTSGSQGFNFGGQNTNAADILAINVDRNRYKESLFPGTFNLTLSGSGGSINLCDNSLDSAVITYLDCGRVFDIVSGSNGHASTSTPTGSTAPGYTASGSYGFFLPDIGVILLNPKALALSASFGGIQLAIDAAVNPNTPYTSVSNTNLFNAIVQGKSFSLNSQETISSNFVFVRVKNAEYNYTSNPTFVSGSSGGLIYSSLINSPQTYVTTVGLYNNNSDLLAVAKLSKPLVKDFTREALIRVKLDW